MITDSDVRKAIEYYKDTYAKNFYSLFVHIERKHPVVVEFIGSQNRRFVNTYERDALLYYMYVLYLVVEDCFGIIEKDFSLKELEALKLSFLEHDFFNDNVTHEPELEDYFKVLIHGNRDIRATAVPHVIACMCAIVVLYVPTEGYLQSKFLGRLT
jgi:hypothetical protein